MVTYADWFFDKEMDFYLTLEPIMNGEVEEKSSEKGIDNKGFDLKLADKMNKSAIEKNSGQNHPGGDYDSNTSEMSRSQSTTCLSEETQAYESPKPITRRKNKSVAPGPPICKDEKRKDGQLGKDNVKTKEIHVFNDKPDKPPRPTVVSNSTLPRPSKSNRENKINENNEEIMKKQPVDDIVLSKKLDESNEKVISHIKKDTITTSMATISTNADSVHISKESSKETYSTNSLDRRSERPVAAPRSIINTTVEVFEKKSDSESNKPPEYSKVNLISVKKEWLLGKDSADIDNLPLKKPAIPERPLTLKPQAFKMNRTSMDPNNFRNNYENILLSSNENLNTGSTDDSRTLQKNYSVINKQQQISVIEVGSSNKNNSNDKVSDNNTSGVVDDDANLIPSGGTTSMEKTVNDNKTFESEVDKDADADDDDDDKDVVVVQERKTAGVTSNRPLSLPGKDHLSR